MLAIPVLGIASRRSEAAAEVGRMTWKKTTKELVPEQVSSARKRQVDQLDSHERTTMENIIRFVEKYFLLPWIIERTWQFA